MHLNLGQQAGLNFKSVKSKVKKARFLSLVTLSALFVGLGTVVRAEGGVHSPVKPITLAQLSRSSNSEPLTFAGTLDADSEVLEDGSYYNAYSFEGSAEQVMIIDLLSDEFDAYLLLLNADGTTLAEDDDSGAGSNARIWVTLPETGTYTVLANTYDAGAMGAYTLTMQESAASQDENLQQALAELEQALATARQEEDTAAEMDILFQMGNVYREAEQYEEAIAHYQQTLEIVREVGDRELELNLLERLVISYFSQGSNWRRNGLYQQALESYQQALANSQQALAIAIDLKNSEKVELFSILTADAYNNKGQSLEFQGRFKDAINSAEAGLEILEILSQAQGFRHEDLFYEDLFLGSFLNILDTTQSSSHSLGKEYRIMGNYEEALEILQQGLSYGEQALRLAENISNKDERTNLSLSITALIHFEIGETYADQYQYEDAIKAREKVLAIHRELGDASSENSTLGSIATAYYNLSEYSKALEYHQQALAIAKNIQNFGYQVQSLQAIAGIYKIQGLYVESESLYREALSIATELNARHQEASILNGLGDIYENQGEYQEALSHYEQALEIIQTARSQLQQADAINNLAEICFLHSLTQGDHAEENLPTWQTDLNQTVLENRRELCLESAWLLESVVLRSIGYVYTSQGNYSQALGLYQQALEISQAIGSRRTEGTNLIRIGDIYAVQGQYSQALDFYEKALTIHQQMNDLFNEGQALNSIGLLYVDLGRYSEALTLLQQSLEIDQKIGSRSGEAASTGNIGLVYQMQGNYGLAIEHHQKSLGIHRELDDRRGESVALSNLASIFQRQGEYLNALDYHQQHLNIVQDIGDRAGESSAFNNIGIVYSSQGRYSEALDQYERSLTLSQEIGDLSRKATTLANIGAVYTSLDNYLKALETTQQALDIAEGINSDPLRVVVINNLGLLHNNQGRYSQALENFQSALAIQRRMGDRASEATTLLNIASAYNSQGNYFQGLLNYQESLAMYEDIGNRQGASDALNGLGSLYFSLGQYPRALDYYQQAFNIRQEIGDRAGEGISFNNIGSVHDAEGNYSEALENYQHALAISTEVGDRLGAATTLSNLGLIYAEQSQYSQALEAYERSLLIRREIGDRAGEGITITNLAKSYQDQGKYQKALDYYQQALAIHREVGDRATEWLSLHNMGTTYLQMNQFNEAESTLYEALTLLESLRPSELSEADRISLSDTQTGTYKYLQRLFIAQNNIPAALEIAERGRARVLAETLTTRLSTPDTITNLDAPDIATIQRIAQQQNATLVQYSIIDPRLGDPELYIWVISPTGTINFQQVALNTLQQPLDELVNTGRTAIGVRGRNDATIRLELTPEAQQRQQQQQQQALQQLHQLLIEPIAAYLPTNETDRIVFIPQGDLFLVPFPALMDPNGDYLIKRHTLLTAPSIQVLDLTQQQRGRTRTSSFAEALVVGNPTPMPALPTLPGETAEPLSYLAGALEEAIAIGDLLQVDPLIEVDATKASVVERMPQAQIIHLATHGLLDYGIPGESVVRDIPGAIALAPSADDNGLLTSAEILQMNLNADLVVLSACDTGQGRITGDGVIGLSRAFITAGVPSVMVSLWAVDDTATAELMVTFYDQWQQTGDKAQALRQAMLTTMATNPDPRLWAAFTLIGEAE